MLLDWKEIAWDRESNCKTGISTKVLPFLPARCEKQRPVYSRVEVVEAGDLEVGILKDEWLGALYSSEASHN